MNINFNDLDWHDAKLVSILIDRSNPGERDTIILQIEWPDSDVTSSLEFYECYALSANMNFGIVADESILKAECFMNSEELELIRTKWGKVGVALESLKCYRINTNSTNSLINIYSLGFRILN